MKETDIVLASIPQSDGAIKTRPVLLLRKLPKYNDFLVCGISSQLNQCIADFDEIISTKSSNFLSTGLKTDSVIRLSFLAVLPERVIAGAIGEIERSLHQKLLKRLSCYLIEQRHKEDSISREIFCPLVSAAADAFVVDLNSYLDRIGKLSWNAGILPACLVLLLPPRWWRSDKVTTLFH